MKIYEDLRSGNRDKVRFTADYLGLRLDWVDIDSFAGETRTPHFLKKNLQGQVPVGEFEEGRYLAQSNAIIRFVANGTRLIPRDTWLMAKTDERLFWEANHHEFLSQAASVI